MVKKLRKAIGEFMLIGGPPALISKRRIDRYCRGYSRAAHWNFFKKVLRNPSIRNICMLGVYYGRDIAYIAAILRDYKRNGWQVTGVDKFEDSAGTDWPEEKKTLRWEEAGFGPAPSLENARACLVRAGIIEGVDLRKDSAESFLVSDNQKFDFIYIDIAHDYLTTRETIRLALSRLKDGGVIAGDDFSNEGTWGVARAVEEAFPRFDLHSDWIWSAAKSDYRGNLA